MKVPKKISPDSLKDTIIQIRYSSEIPNELLIGTFYSLFKNELIFIEGKILSDGLVKQSVGGYFSDKEKEFKINVDNNGITFNSISIYQGWDKYYSFIKMVLNKLIENKIIDAVHRIGIRYISQYENIDIFKNTNIDISFNLNKELNYTQFRTEIKLDKYNVILSLLNLIELNNNKVSIIDIDLIKKYEKQDNNNFISDIDNAHQKQKEIFFSLLTKEFLNKFNPEY